MQLVLDSSVLVKFLVSEREDNIDQADKLLERARQGITSMSCPELAKYEIGNVLKYKKIEDNQRFMCLSTLYKLPIKYYPQNSKLAQRSLEIALSVGISNYDATFLALAENLDATLVTANPKHQKILEGITVVALKDYK